MTSNRALLLVHLKVAAVAPRPQLRRIDSSVVRGRCELALRWCASGGAVVLAGTVGMMICAADSAAAWNCLVVVLSSGAEWCWLVVLAGGQWC